MNPRCFAAHFRHTVSTVIRSDPVGHAEAMSVTVSILCASAKWLKEPEKKPVFVIILLNKCSLRQEDRCKVKASPGYLARPCLKNKDQSLSLLLLFGVLLNSCSGRQELGQDPECCNNGELLDFGTAEKRKRNKIHVMVLVAALLLLCDDDLTLYCKLRNTEKELCRK